MESKQYISELIERARKAQIEVEKLDQKQVDEVVAAMAWAMVQEEVVNEIAEFAVQESQLGNVTGKKVKLSKKIRGTLRDMKGQKSVGIIERIPEKGLIKIAKPVGVIGALVPTTNPEATPVIKAMDAIKGRNAIIFAPHPRTKKTNKKICDILTGVLEKYNLPKDLIISIEEPTVEISGELMKQCDLVVATGGSGMVKAAYSSGTPAYGVGAGNAVTIIDETADLADAAHKIMLSKTFDYATSCSSENSAVIVESVYDKTVQLLVNEGGHLANAEEKAKLQAAIWVDGHINRDIVAQPATRIAEIAGIQLKDNQTFFIVEEDGVGSEHPFSGEKMSVVLTVFKVKDFETAVDKVNEITGYQGSGHSCGIHTTDDQRIEQLGLSAKVSRIMVRQPHCYGNSGNWDNGMPFTLTLGCGTWGGNISSENITWRHFINVTWVSCPIPEVVPDDDELFDEVKR